MLADLREIEGAIAELERSSLSRSGCELLAALYTIRNQSMEERGGRGQGVSRMAVEPLGEYGDSEFLRAIVGKDPADAWRVMDGLMDDLRVVNAKVYNSVMRKLDAI